MCFQRQHRRQFEFVPETWYQWPYGFHGGRHGRKPVITPKQAGD